MSDHQGTDWKGQIRMVSPDYRDHDPTHERIKPVPSGDRFTMGRDLPSNDCGREKLPLLYKNVLLVEYTLSRRCFTDGRIHTFIGSDTVYIYIEKVG